MVISCFHNTAYAFLPAGLKPARNTFAQSPSKVLVFEVFEACTVSLTGVRNSGVNVLGVEGVQGVSTTLTLAGLLRFTHIGLYT